MSPDGKYIASAGLDKNIYVWSLGVALKVVHAEYGNAKLEGCPSKSRVVRQPILRTRLETRTPSHKQSSFNTKDIAPTRPRRDIRNVLRMDDRNGTETDATIESNTTSKDHAPSPKRTRAPSHALQDLTDELQGRPRYPITSGGFGDIWNFGSV
ncbi:uncharacterized protein F5147DRAFT_694443, partial [Suillus discolor]